MVSRKCSVENANVSVDGDGDSEYGNAVLLLAFCK